jgi:putative transposase
MIDELTKERLCIEVARSIRSKRLIEALEQLIKERGCPMVLRSDLGPKSFSLALLQWAADRGLRNLLVEPGKPWQNGANESFNGKFRDECLAVNWFYSRAYANFIIETWPKHYNDARPHSSLEYQTPLNFVSQWKSESTTGAVVYR